MNNLVIYFGTVVSLFLFIYIIPGIALLPKFILNPRTAATIPFISISMVVSAQYILSTLNQFNHKNVIIFTLALFLVAIYRLYGIYKVYLKFDSNWQKSDLKALLLIMFSSIPLMIILGFDGFQHADEIMSWNLWAKKIYFNEERILSGNIYPLLLSSLIAFCYKFIGNIDYQLPIRFTFSIIYVSSLFIVYTFANSRNKVGILFITYIIVFLIIGVGYEYKKVWADTLMSGFMVASLALLISLSNTQRHINKNISPISILLASIILISAATLTKQGAIVWTMLIYPLLAYVIINNNNKLSNLLKLSLLVPILTPILWYFIGGNNFHTNVGVINRSMGGRGYFDQILFGFNESFIAEGRFILLLFMLTIFIVLLRKINFEKAIIAFGITLSTIFLIFFGAYETTRLYLHVILFGWLVLFAYGDHITSTKIGSIISIIGNSLYTYSVVCVLFIFWTFNSFNYRMMITEPVTNFLDGRQVQVNWVIRESGVEQYKNILESKMGLWAHDSHVWGIYYGVDNFKGRGGLRSGNDDIRGLVNSIIDENIGWIYSHEKKDLSEIKRIQDFCSGSIIKIDTSSNMYWQTLNKIDIEILKSCIEKNK